MTDKLTALELADWLDHHGEKSRHADAAAELRRLAAIAATQPAAEAVPPAGDVEALNHVANEWANMATNGLQWLRNIVQGISDPKVALANMEDNLLHCRKVNDERKATQPTLSSFARSGEQARTAIGEQVARDAVAAQQAAFERCRSDQPPVGSFYVCPEKDVACDEVRMKCVSCPARRTQPAADPTTRPMPYEPTEAMRWAGKGIDPGLTHEQLRAIWSAMWTTAPFVHPAAEAVDDSVAKLLALCDGLGLPPTAPAAFSPAQLRAVGQAIQDQARSATHPAASVPTDLIAKARYALAMLVNVEACEPWQLELYDKTMNELAATNPAASVPPTHRLVPVEALTRWRAAFAEELSAWDINPPIHHVKTSHDEIDALLNAAPPAQVPLTDEQKALDLLALLFDAYEDGVPCFEDGDPDSAFIGHAFRLDDETFHACADLLNRRRPRAHGITATGQKGGV